MLQRFLHFIVAMTLCLIVTLLLCSCQNKSLQSVKTSKGDKHVVSNSSNQTNATQQSHNIQKTPLHVNVFVENSGSMLGYVSQGNDFHQSIDDILTSIQSQGVSASTIRKFYINSKCFEQKDISTTQFIKDMTKRTATTFKADASSTSMMSLLDTVFRRTTKGNLSIFISDCIISPGKKQNAAQFVGAERNGIQLLAQSQAKKGNAIIVLQLLSDFNGYLYDCQDNKKKITHKRPFYIWIVGERSVVEWFYNIIDTNKIAGYKNLCVFTPIMSDINVQNRILTTNSGIIDNNSIQKAKLSRNNNHKFSFSFGINIRNYNLLRGYTMDKGNFSLSNSGYKIERIAQKINDPQFTHLITISTTSPITQNTLFVRLKKPSIPNWISTYNLDRNACNQYFSQLDKTYAIKDVLEGVYQGYYGNNSMVIAQTTIKIN